MAKEIISNIQSGYTSLNSEHLFSKTEIALPPATGTSLDISDYYTDTIARAGEEITTSYSKLPLGTKSHLEIHTDKLSAAIDNELKKKDINHEKLHALIHQVIMGLMRHSAKSDHEHHLDINVQIKSHAAKIQGTYNTWPGVVITVISAGISIGGGLSGISPFFPPSLISPDTARTLSGVSLSIGNAGTGVGSLGSLITSRTEGERQVLQIELKHLQDKEEDRKGAKHGNKETQKSARAGLDEFNRSHHENVRSMCSV